MKSYRIYCSKDKCSADKHIKNWFQRQNNLNITVFRKYDKDFRDFPEDHIVSSYPIIKRKPILNNSIEVIHTDNNQEKLTIMEVTGIQFNAFVVNYSFYHLKNTYFCCCNSFNVNSTSYNLDDMNVLVPHQQTVRFSFDDVVGISIPMWYYGDISMGVFYRIPLLPEEYFRRSVMLCPTDRSVEWISEVLEVLNINTILLNVPSSEYVFARNLYTVLPDWRGETHDRVWVSVFGEPCWRFAELLRRRLGLDDVVPFRFVLQNRKEGCRVFNNLPAFHEALVRRYPGVPFEIIPPMWNSIQENVRDAVEMLWVFHCIGSNAMRFVFMSPGTVAVQYMCDIFESQQFCMFSSRGIYLIVTWERNQVVHYKYKDVEINIERTLKAVEHSFYTLRTQLIFNSSFKIRFPYMEWKKGKHGSAFVTLPKLVNYSF